MPHLKFRGLVLKQYHGIDQDTVVVAGPGDVIHVSDHKADRLLKDFPMEFELHATGTDYNAQEPPPVDPIKEPESASQPETKTVEPTRNKMIRKSNTKGKNKWR